MSTARFDTGQQYLWEPLGFYNNGQNVNTSPNAVYAFPGGSNGIFRIDYASIVLRFLNILDIQAWAELSLVVSPGVYTSFLAVGSSTTAIAGERFMAQLTLPFYVTGAAAIWMRGGAFGTVASNFDVTVGVSRAFTF